MFQEVEAPRFQANRHMKVVRLSALRAGRLEIFLVLISVSGSGSLVVSMLASGTQDRGFAPGRRIFRAKKPSACLPSEGK
jgi:hypothetical protein